MTLPHPHTILQRRFLSSSVDLLHPAAPPVSLETTCSAREVVKLLCEHRIGSVVLLDVAGKVVGIVTERDIIEKVALSPRADGEIPVREIMTPNPQSLPKHASIARALFLMANGHYRHLLVNYPNEPRTRIVSVKDFVDFVYARVTKKRVGESDIVVAEESLVDKFFDENVMVLGPNKPVTVRSDQSVFDALTMLRDGKIGSVAIRGADKRVVGIFTERDYILKVAFQPLDMRTAPVSQVMTADPKSALVTTSISYAFNLMSEGGFRHVPIVNNEEELVGMLSVKNFVDYLSRSIVEQLEGYQAK